jgi:hypothetical protein
MNPDLEKLIELQNADREIARLSQEIAALPRRVAEIEAKLAAQKAQVEQTTAAMKSDELARRQHESAIQSEQQKISKYREQSLGVKTNEAYRALMHEIEFSEKTIRSLEDKILEIMVASEAREKELKTAHVELKAATAEVEKEKVEAHTRSAEDETQLAEWNARRTSLRQAISPDALRHYDRVLKLRGTALAEARAGKCMGCQVVLRPQVYNDARTNQQVLTCDSCNRILYFDPAHEPQPVEPAPGKSRRSRKTMDGAWYYLPHADGVPAFAAFLNRRGGAAMWQYDAESGQKMFGPVERDGNFQESFAEEINQATWISETVPGQDEGGWEQLPAAVLDKLKNEWKGVQTLTSDLSAAQ